MPFTYQRDDARQRVVVTLEGGVDAADILAVFERHRQENVPAYAMLYDVRRTVSRLKTTELGRIISERRSTNVGCGPVAFVANDPELYRLICSYVAMARPSGFNMEVFRDMVEAEAWLRTNTAVKYT